MHNSKQQFSLIWIVLTVITLFVGMIVSAAGSLSGFKNLGLYMIAGAIVSIIFYVLYSAFQWFQFRKGEGLANLIIAYIILAILFTLGGLVGAFLTFPDAFYFFFAGLVMFGVYWIGVLIKNII